MVNLLDHMNMQNFLYSMLDGKTTSTKRCRTTYIFCWNLTNNLKRLNFGFKKYSYSKKGIKASIFYDDLLYLRSKNTSKLRCCFRHKSNDQKTKQNPWKILLWKSIQAMHITVIVFWEGIWRLLKGVFVLFDKGKQ